MDGSFANRADALAEMKALLGPKGWLSGDGEDAGRYVTEWRGRLHGETAFIARPDSTGQVAAIMRICAAHRIAVVPQGGNTGLAGGSVPVAEQGAICLSLKRMNRIRGIDAANFTATVEAGCILSALHDAATEAGLHFPLSLASKGSCTIGGNLASNAGGTMTIGYGNAREQCLGLEVVLADGRVWNGLSGLRKDNTGYDLRDLFIGSEGTLGIITAATLRLVPAPGATVTLMAALPSTGAALALLARLRSTSGDRLTAFELIHREAAALSIKHMDDVHDPFDQPHPWYVLVDCKTGGDAAALEADMEAALEAALEAGEISDATIARSVAQARGLWHLRETIPEAQTREGASMKHDISVPVSAIPAFLDAAIAKMAEMVPGARPIPFGHMGDGNIHLNFSQPAGMEREEFLKPYPQVNRAMHDIVAAHGGSFSAEHGVGSFKAGEMLRLKDPVALDMMRAIKRALDPDNLMNPGRVISP